MFVFADDDVSKKDLKKISKKIEKQLSKWEKKDREEDEKRKRDVSDDIAETSDFRKRKKLKIENKSINNEDTVIECSCSFSSEAENTVQKPACAVKETVQVENVVHETIETKESKQKHEHDDDELSDWEIIIDVNEKGHCSFTTVTGSENPDHKRFQNFEDKVGDESENEIQIHVTDRAKDLDNIVIRSANDVDETSSFSELRNIKECDLIVDVNEANKQLLDDVQLAKTDAAKNNTDSYKDVRESDSNTPGDESYKTTCTIAVGGTKGGNQSDFDDTGFSSDSDVKPLTIPEECDIVALDCEFVGVGPTDQSALGRCSIVDFHGNIICDIYARPEERITNYRTRWSGITKNHMKRAIPVESALSQIANIIRNKVVVGHALQNDFSVLEIPHPEMLTRDTAFYRPLRERADPRWDANSMALKRLALQLLDRVIQTGRHCSVEDARAAMDLYKLVRDEWESRIIQGQPIQDEIVKTPTNVKNREKRQRRKAKQRERFLKKQNSVASLPKCENNVQTNKFHRSKSDSNLLSRQHVYSNSYGDKNRWTGGQQYHSWIGDQQYLQDEYWQDVVDDSFNSFSDSYQ